MTPASFTWLRTSRKMKQKNHPSLKNPWKLFLKSTFFPLWSLKIYVCRERLVGFFLGWWFGHLKLLKSQKMRVELVWSSLVVYQLAILRPWTLKKSQLEEIRPIVLVRPNQRTMAANNPLIKPYLLARVAFGEGYPPMISGGSSWHWIASSLTCSILLRLADTWRIIPVNVGG